MAQDITVPDLGDFKDVEVIDVLVKAGDRIEVDTPLITLETEKATMDVPSTTAGVVKSVTIKKGDRVSKGNVIVQVEGAAGGEKKAAPAASAASPAPAKPAPAAESPKAEPPKAKPSEAPAAAAAPASAPAPAARPSAITINEAGFATAHASPSVRKFARELGVDLGSVKGTGIKGRVTPDDVKAWVKQALKSGVPGGGGALPKVPEVDFAKFGAVEVKPLGRIQKISGPRLQASWLNVPHVWLMDEADITDLEETRNLLKGVANKAGVKLTPLAFILRACVKALREFPLVNTSLDASGQNLVWKKYVHLGFAADTPNGLVVPVIRDADKKDVYELARELAVLSEKARAGKLTAVEMQGASFTVLGVARSSMRPVYQDGKFVPRLILPFTLAYDHRVIDGAAAVRFTTFLAQKLSDVKALLEAVP
jgi:pyruvate dehydrogenase E2 component (dihydrolipoamide acetyltransferase)